MRLNPLVTTTILACLVPTTTNALIHEQVAFDSADVCWWSLTPPDPVCPVLRQHNLTDLVNTLREESALRDVNEWRGGAECEGPYCLYANRGFAGGRGVALVTNPDGLAKLKQVGDLLQEYGVSFADDDDNVPFRTTTQPHAEDEHPEVVVASRALRRGDPIMAHTPVLLVHQAFRRDAPPERQQHLLRLAVNALPAATAKKLKKVLGSTITTDALSSFEVNWGATDDDNTDNNAHDAVFPEAAALRHHCRPNTASYVDPTTLMHITTAAQPIPPGEALTRLSRRVDPLAPREDRQAQHAHACSQCSSLPPDEAADSETRLREIRWIDAKLRDPDSPEVSAPGLVTYHLGLHENEQLHCCLARPYRLAAENLNMLGYDKYAAKYADAAVEALKMERGEGAPEVRDMEALRRDPRGHPTWRQRVNRAREVKSGGVTQAAAAMTPAA